MTLFLITLVFFVVIIFAMAIGYIVQKKSLAGSCGGLGTLGIEKACNCEKPCEKRLEREKKAAQEQQKIDVKNI